MLSLYFFHFFFNDTSSTDIYTLSLHDALPISIRQYDHRQTIVRESHDHVPEAHGFAGVPDRAMAVVIADPRSEEHTSELQSRFDLVCRLLLEKKKDKPISHLQTAGG